MVSPALTSPRVVGGFLSGVARVETEAVAAVVAGVTMVTDNGDPEVSTVGATVVEVDTFGTVVQDIDRGQRDAVDTDDGSDSVVVLAAVILCMTLVALQFVTDTAAPVV